MKRLLILVGLVTLLLGMAWLSQSTASVGHAPKAAQVAPSTQQMQPTTPPNTPPCPPEFASVCVDVQGRRCRQQACTTTDTGDKKCQRADGTIFSCLPGNQTVHVTTCPCRDTLHLICCEDNSCNPPCEDCAPGTQQLSCA